MRLSDSSETYSSWSHRAVHVESLFSPARDEDAKAPVKVKELIKKIEADGWTQSRMRGSHRQFKHLTKSGTVTIAGKPSVDVPPGTLNSVLKQAGLKN